MLYGFRPNNFLSKFCLEKTVFSAVFFSSFFLISCIFLKKYKLRKEETEMYSSFVGFCGFIWHLSRADGTE